MSELQHSLKEDNRDNIILSVGEAGIIGNDREGWGTVYFFTGDVLFKIYMVSSVMVVKSIAIIGETKMISFRAGWLNNQVDWQHDNLDSLDQDSHVYLGGFLLREFFLLMAMGLELLTWIDVGCSLSVYIL